MTARGVEEANAVARRLSAQSLRIDAAFSSALLRARQSTQVILAQLEGTKAFVEDAALNERDYGELTGLDKAEAAARWGAGQVRRWRRGYIDQPPGGESLRDTVARVLPFYLRRILPCVLRGQTSLVVAHGNSVRALIMALDGHTAETIPDVELATGEIRIYGFAADATVESRQTLDA